MNVETLFVTAGWFGFALTGALLVCALAYVLDDRRRTTATPTPEPAPIPVPRIPAQRTPTSAAVIVHSHDAAAYDEFLRELILTPHVEEVLS